MNEADLALIPVVAVKCSSQGLPRDSIGNPLIEALPELLSDSDVAHRLQQKLVFDISEHGEETHIRVHDLERLGWHFSANGTSSGHLVFLRP